jgi:outer membrane protein TolC
MRSFFHGVSTLAVAAALAVGGCALTPDPLTTDALRDHADDTRRRVTAHSEPIRGTIDLHEAMRRALTHNLDHKVEVHEAALRLAELDLAHADLLPKVVASTGYAARDEPLGSSSFNLVTNTQNFGFSTSQDQRIRSSDLAFSWHVLDFGLSLVRARQTADKALMAEEARRKVVHRLMEDVRIAYWRAWTAQRLSGRMRRLEARTRAALAGSRALSDDRTTSPLTAVTYRRELIEVQRTLRELQRELTAAQYQLAALMNVPLGSGFTLAAPRGGVWAGLPDIESQIGYALEHRPEVRDVLYRQRINRLEAKAALLELLPGAHMFAGSNVDSNSFLLHDQWLSWGAKASWNVIKVFQYPAKRTVIEAQEQMLDQRALSLTMAIMTQIYVGNARLHHYGRELETAAAYQRTQTRIVGYVRAERAADRVSEQTLLREELNAIVSEARLDIAWAGQQTALANVLAAMGRDPAHPAAAPVHETRAREVVAVDREARVVKAAATADDVSARRVPAQDGPARDGATHDPFGRQE